MKNTNKTNRNDMRDNALASRAAISPTQFDGTAETYNAQIAASASHLRAAIESRDSQPTNSMSRYRCNGFRSVSAESMSAAADIFASRAARREYGRRGYARTCNQQSYTQDGSLAEYSAFIGYSTGLHQTTGHNIYFTVYRDC